MYVYIYVSPPSLRPSLGRVSMYTLYTVIHIHIYTYLRAIGGYPIIIYIFKYAFYTCELYGTGIYYRGIYIHTFIYNEYNNMNIYIYRIKYEFFKFP
jgi:hypothetical protein